MLNKQLLAKSVVGANCVNAAGGAAYALEARQALAQLALTGTLNDTYYVDAHAQLDELLQRCFEVSPAFVAKTAIYAREQGRMKDTPVRLSVSGDDNQGFAVLAGKSADSGAITVVIQLWRNVDADRVECVLRTVKTALRIRADQLIICQIVGVKATPIVKGPELEADNLVPHCPIGVTKLRGTSPACSQISAGTRAPLAG